MDDRKLTREEAEERARESTKFSRKELRLRNTRLNRVIIVSVFCVIAGIANVSLFNLPSNNNPTRDFYNCTILTIANKAGVKGNIPIWASTGTFAVLVLIVASVGKSTDNAWTWQTTAFAIMAPFAIMVCLGIIAGEALLGMCTISPIIGNIQSVTEITQKSYIFYSLIDILIAIFGVVLFLSLLIVWIQVLNKRTRSEENHKQELEDKDERKVKKETEKKGTEENPGDANKKVHDVAPASSIMNIPAPITTTPSSSLPMVTPAAPAVPSNPGPYVIIIQPPAPAAQPQMSYPEPPTPLYPTYESPYFPPLYFQPTLPPPRPRPRPLRPGFPGYAKRKNHRAPYQIYSGLYY